MKNLGCRIGAVAISAAGCCLALRPDLTMDSAHETVTLLSQFGFDGKFFFFF
jgi:hypothetical protein